MKHIWRKLHFGWLFRIVLCERHPQTENAAFPWCVFRAKNCSMLKQLASCIQGWEPEAKGTTNVLVLPSLEGSWTVSYLLQARWIGWCHWREKRCSHQGAHWRLILDQTWAAGWLQCFPAYCLRVRSAHSADVQKPAYQNHQISIAWNDRKQGQEWMTVSVSVMNRRFCPVSNTLSKAQESVRTKEHETYPWDGVEAGADIFALSLEFFERLTHQSEIYKFNQIGRENW